MADKLILSDIRTAVRTKLNDETFDADIIDMAVNDFQNQLFTDYRLWQMEDTTNPSLGTGEYEVTIEDDVITFINFSLTDSDGAVHPFKAGFLSYDEFMRQHPDYATATAGRPLHWTRFGSLLRMSCPADATYTLNIDYLREPELMVEDEDEAEVTTTYKQLMVTGALVLVLENNEDYDYAENERAKLQGLITAFVRNNARGATMTGPIVMKTRRRGRGSDWGLRSEY